MLTVASQRDISIAHVFLMSLHYELTALRYSNIQPKKQRGQLPSRHNGDVK